MTLTFKQLQEEHRRWSEYNFDNTFPTTDHWTSVYGVMEELGELARALLKRHQNIRGSQDEHTAKAKDAVGDMVIFLASTCSALGFDLQEIVETTWKEVSQRDYKKDEELKGTTKTIPVLHCRYCKRDYDGSVFKVGEPCPNPFTRNGCDGHLELKGEPRVNLCQLCGNPMPPGEEMFNYHGYSGPCPTNEKKSSVVAYNPPIPIDPFPVYGYFTLNGEEHKALTPELSYEHICSLAGLKPEHAPTIIARWKGSNEDETGSKFVLRGKPIKVRDGMRITACYTGNA